MDDLATPSTPPRRAARHRRRRRARGLVAVLAALAVAVGVLLVTGTFSTDPAPAARRAAADEPARAVAHLPKVEAPERRALTPTDPLRLWIAGDSLAGSLGPSLGELTAATGVVQPQYDSRVSSGLENDAFFDWPEHATEQLEELNPEAVVFIIGTNDANAWSDDQAADYAERVESMMRLLVGVNPGRDVFWVNAPVMKDADLEEHVLEVNEIQRQAAARVPGITYIDAHRRFADATGEYQSSVVGPTGTRISLRAGDGIHFSPEGADYLAETVYQALDAHWHITAQRVEGQSKQVRVTKGSTQVDGTYRSSGNGSSSGGSTYRTSTTTRAYQPPSTTTSSTTPEPAPPPEVEPPTTSSTTGAGG